MQVSSKTSMSNAIFHNLESGSNELQSGFSENQLKLIEKADTQHLNLPNVEFRTSWCTTRFQNPSLVYSTPSELSAILYEPCSQKSRCFLGTAKFSSLYAAAPRVPPRVLAVWAKTLRGQLKDCSQHNVQSVYPNLVPRAFSLAREKALETRLSPSINLE